MAKLNIEHQISSFDSSMGLLKASIEKDMRYDLILLDIAMDKIDGIELARRIRKIDNEVDIIFITSKQEYALDGYDVNALHYLMKPVNTTKLETLIKTAYAKKFQESVIVVKSGNQHFRVPVGTIVSIETIGRQVKLSLLDKEIKCPGKLIDILSELPCGQFVRCHQAFAVNVSNVRTLSRKTAVTIDGKEIPVSRTYLDDTRNAIMSRMGAE